MDSSRRTGAAIADGRLDAVTLRDLIERRGVALREPDGNICLLRHDQPFVLPPG